MSDAVIISFINLKGGVGKTSSAINIANELSSENRVLIVDMDPQFNATQAVLNYQLSNHTDKIPSELLRLMEEDFEKNYKNDIPENQEGSSAEEAPQFTIKSQLIYKQLKEAKMTAKTLFTKDNVVSSISNPNLVYNIKENLDLLCGDLDLFETLIGDTAGKHDILEVHFGEYNFRDNYDYIIIDCPPNWTILTQASLFASDYYVIPSKIDLFSSIGIGLLQNLVNSTFYSSKSAIHRIYQMYRNDLKKEDVKPVGVLFTLTHDMVISDKLKKDLKKNISDLDFLVSEIPYHSSVPLKFSMYSETGEKYESLTNSLEKVVVEIKEKITLDKEAEESDDQ